MYFIILENHIVLDKYSSFRWKLSSADACCLWCECGWSVVWIVSLMQTAVRGC